MKKNKTELLRFQNIIEKDRTDVKDNFYELLTVDVNKLLKEYFDYKDLPYITIEKNGSLFAVKIKVDATCIRNFQHI